jgi:hypothetical protein
MALPGRCATIKAPTTMNAVNASSSATVSASGSCWKLPLATMSAPATSTLTTKMASMNQATQVERLRTVPVASSEAPNPPSAGRSAPDGLVAHRPAV